MSETLKGAYRGEEGDCTGYVFVGDVALYPDRQDSEKLKGKEEALYQLMISSVTPASAKVAISL